MIKVMIVEDDEVTALHLKYALQKLDYDVVAMAHDTLQARNKAKIYQPDIILLDISLDASDDGIRFAQYLSENCTIPFVYLSSHTEASFIHDATQTQPYGYIVKPFEPNTLHTTIQMALVKFKELIENKSEINRLAQEKEDLEKIQALSQDGEQIPLGKAYSFDMKRKELYYQGTLTKLTKNEKLCMHLLILNIDHVVSFEQLERYIWEDGSATENSVRTLVWRLRAKLEAELIENISGQGYRLTSS